MEHIEKYDIVSDNGSIDIGNGVAVKYTTNYRDHGNSYTIGLSLDHFGKEIIGETSFELSAPDKNRFSVLERFDFIHKSINEFIESNLTVINELKSKMTFGESILMQKITELTEEVKELRQQVEELSDNQWERSQTNH